MTNASATTCAPSVSQVGKTPNHSPAQYGTSNGAGWIGSQPVPCIVRAVWPTITTSTTAISTPVAISIFL